MIPSFIHFLTITWFNISVWFYLRTSSSIHSSVSGHIHRLVPFPSCCGSWSSKHEHSSILMHLKRCSTSLGTRELPIKTEVIPVWPQSKWLSWREQMTTWAGQDVGKPEPLFTARGSKLANAAMEISVDVSRKTRNGVIMWPCYTPVMHTCKYILEASSQSHLDPFCRWKHKFVLFTKPEWTEGLSILMGRQHYYFTVAFSGLGLHGCSRPL